MSKKGDCCKGPNNDCCSKQKAPIGAGRPGPSGAQGPSRSIPGPSGVQGIRPPSNSRLVPPSSTRGPPNQTRVPSGLRTPLQRPQYVTSTPKSPGDLCESSCAGSPSQGLSQGPPRGQYQAPPRGQYQGSIRAPSQMPTRAPSQGPSRAPPGIARPPPGVVTKTVIAGVSRPPMAAISKTVSAEVTKPHPKGGTGTAKVISRTVITGPSATSIRKAYAASLTKIGIGKTASQKSVKSDKMERIVKPDKIEKSSKLEKSTASAKTSIPPPKKQSRLQRFDKTATAELSRRKTASTTATTATSDINLLDAVDCLAKAEAANSFAGAVAAAEAAAASAPDPRAAEEAAARGAKSFQAEIVDVVQEDVPGLKPIQILGYVGITRPTYAAK